jgi:cystathionine beta-lyase family protein involved in aluminum resistance
VICHVYKHLQKDSWIKQKATAMQQRIMPVIRQIEKRVDEQQARVLQSFCQHSVSDIHLHASTGYGYDDLGRATLEKIFADLFGAEMALVRPQLLCGTHAIAACLYGVLRPGDELVYLTGEPYDTLQPVLGSERDGSGSLADYGITYQAVSLLPQGEVDWQRFHQVVTERTRLIAIQRSRGYADRSSFHVAYIGEMIRRIKEIGPHLVVLVDNCYGEFVEMEEPTHVGADLIAGSLIKNPGGGLAKAGGYIAGKADWVKRAAARAVAPGIGVEGGATHGYLRDYYQGLFLAPHVVGEALKGAVFTAALLEEIGFVTTPSWQEMRTDIIQQVHLGHPDLLLAFCQGIQSASPVDAHLLPIPASLPGYADPIVMAAGTFVQGASIELSADAPLRPPYMVYLQGGLTYSHVKIAVVQALEKMITTGHLSPKQRGS